MLYSTHSIFYLIRFDFYRNFFQHLDFKILDLEDIGDPAKVVDYSYNTNSYICDLHSAVRCVLKKMRVCLEKEDKKKYRGDCTLDRLLFSKNC